MKYSLLFILALIAVSGFIAYWGDILGRRMGKRRLTLFGMRPKYTAIVVTTITGMIISALVVLTLVAVNAQFRRVLTEGEQILAQNKTLTFVNSDLESRNKALMKRGRDLEKEVAKRKSEVQKARTKADAATKAMRAAERRVTGLEQEITARYKELVALQKKNDLAESELAKLGAQLTARSAELAERTEELRGLQAQMDTAKSELEQARRERQDALNQKEIAQIMLDEAQAQLGEAQMRIEQARDTLEKQQKLIDLQRREITEVEYRMRSSALVLRQGDELGRTVISWRQSAFGIKGDLLSLLASSSDKALEFGAKVGANGRAVLVVPHAVDAENLDVLDVKVEEACIDLLRQAVMRSFADVVAQVVVQRNTLAGEQVPVEVRLYENTMVYKRGDLVASANFDGRNSEGRILLAVIEFIQKDVSETARKAGVIPPAAPAPRSFISDESRSHVESLMAVVDRIKALNDKVVAEAYANENVYSSGPLNMGNLSFSVRKPDQPSSGSGGG